MDFSVYSDVVQDLCYCQDVNGLFNFIGIENDPIHWRLLLTVRPEASKQFYLIMQCRLLALSYTICIRVT